MYNANDNLEGETALLLTGAKLATMTPHGRDYGLVEKGAVLLRDGLIAWAGPEAEAPPADGAARIDLEGRVLTPGLVDCHTHLVYGGNRAAEFEMRLNGASYSEIAEAGGGIVSTVKATRAASEEELAETGAERLWELMDEGVTTVEIKSGYGLDLENELKMLRAARAIGERLPVSVVTTFLGAHALPPERKGDQAGYLEEVVEVMLPAAAEAGLADMVDAFCEKIAFSAEETARVFEKARALGLPVKLHAEQLSDQGGARMAAADFAALSCDHVEYAGQDAIDAMAKAGTVAVLLPGAFYYLKEKQKPPVEALRKAGVPLALATDLNPGSSPVHSLLSVLNMACLLFGLTPEEALRGVTVNGARALGLKDRGVIAPGLRADLAVFEIERPGELAYPLGHNPCVQVYQAGRLVLDRIAA